MGGEDHVDSLAIPDVADQFQHLDPSLGIQTVRGLVEEDQFGTVHQGLRQLDSLFHSAGVSLHIPIPGFSEPDVMKDLMGSLQ